MKGAPRTVATVEDAHKESRSGRWPRTKLRRVVHKNCLSFLTQKLCQFSCQLRWMAVEAGADRELRRGVRS